MKIFVLIIINFIIAIASLCLMLYPSYGYDSTLQFIGVTLGIISIATIVISNTGTSPLRNKYILVVYLFLLGYFVVFFQFNIDLLLGLKSPENVVFCSPRVINECTFISVLGIASFAIGYVYAHKFSKLSKGSVFKKPLKKEFFILLKLLMCLMTVLFAHGMTAKVLSGQFVYNQETLNENAGSMSNYAGVMIYVIAFCFLVVKIYQYKVFDKHPSFVSFVLSNGLVFNGCLLIYLSLMFMIGDRGPLITILSAYLISFEIVSKHPLKLKLLLPLIIVGAFALTAIGNIRNTNHKISLEDVLSFDMSNSHNDSFIPWTSELSGSYKTLSYTVDRVPSRYPYFYGLIQIRELITAVPFMHRFVPFAFSNKSYENSSTAYCTYLIQGIKPRYGNGTSLLANIYLDFGVSGIVLIMLLLGSFIYRLDVELIYGNNINWMTAGIIFFSFALYISRAPITTPLYYFIPAYLILSLKKYFYK